MSLNEEFKQRLEEWLNLKNQLKEIGSDTRVLRNREKDLRNYIKQAMSAGQVDAVKSEKHSVVVSHNVKSAKASESVKSLKERIRDFFENSGQKNIYDLLLVYLDETRPDREVDSIRVNKS